MASDRDRWLAILQNNVGFDTPALWIDYAEKSGFKPVAAARVPNCPDCGAQARVRPFGQFVYYSTLVHLLRCNRCGLIWADAHIDPETLRQHFELAYKDDTYFRSLRAPVFDHIAAIVDSAAPTGAHVLDIGGARGDLMSHVTARRPDLTATVHDISSAATNWAASHFGFATLTGDAHALAAHTGTYDVVVLSDVLYYEPNLKLLWSALSRLVRPGGSIVIRVPNRALLARVRQRWFEMTNSAHTRQMQDRVRFHNPEHIFVFRQRYLRERLASLGFGSIRFVPSPLLKSERLPAARTVFYQLARVANVVSAHSVVLTPSMVVVAKRAL